MRTTSNDFAASSIPRSAFRIPNSRSVPRSAFRVPSSRRGFTLVEMLVVIAIIIVLMSLVLGFYPKREVRHAADGADQLQTLLASAKSRAMRDNAPRGIRLIPDAQGNFRNFEYIEVPEPYAPNVQLNIGQAANFALLAGNHTSSIFAGDMLEITHGVGSIHRILSRTIVGGNTQVNFVAGSSPPAASNSPLNLTNNYRFIRQSRPLMGETPYQLPDKVFVSAAASQNLPMDYIGVNREIMFSPSGQVINATAGRIVLWLADDNNVSKPTLLTVYSYTGSTAAHPEGPPGFPYQFTQDGKSSGQ